jgi:hypothetical protein
MNIMRHMFIILIAGLLIFSAGCITRAEKIEVNSDISFVFEADRDSSGFCIFTSTSSFDGKIRYSEADDEFMMLDHLLSEEIPCYSDADCYEFLLKNEDYRSMAPEFEPYLNCQSKGIIEVNFKD